MHDGTPGAADAASTPCPNGCGQNVNPRGRGSHNRSCKALARKVPAADPIRQRIIDKAEKCMEAIRQAVVEALTAIDDNDQPAALRNILEMQHLLDERDTLLGLLDA